MREHSIQKRLDWGLFKRAGRAIPEFKLSCYTKDMHSEKRVGVGCGVMILRGNTVLLGKRHDDPEKASSLLHGEGTWTMPGGKLDFGESFEDAAYREVLEETGLRIDRKKIRHISITNDRVPNAHFITIGFLCTEFAGEPRVMEPDEITEWRWFPLNNLPHPLFPPSEKILKNYLDRSVYKH
jgi:8-oxo-dGTP diphosphatase